MIIVVWLALAALVCGGMYAVRRILARDDMPLSRAGIIFSASLAGTARVAPETSERQESRTLNGPAGEPGPGGGGSARSSSAAGESSYRVLYAMASAVNDAWLDRLFSGAHRG